jgi:hypothetical protein
MLSTYALSGSILVATLDVLTPGQPILEVLP